MAQDDTWSGSPTHLLLEASEAGNLTRWTLSRLLHFQRNKSKEEEERVGFVGRQNVLRDDQYWLFSLWERAETRIIMWLNSRTILLPWFISRTYAHYQWPILPGPTARTYCQALMPGPIARAYISRTYIARPYCLSPHWEVCCPLPFWQAPPGRGRQ